MANLITFSRLLLLFAVIGLAYQPPSWLQLVCIPVLILVFVTDGLDGWVARRRGEASVFGAVFDIAVDRIVELAMWAVLIDLGQVGVWVLLVFIVRGSLVDAIRARQAAEQGQAPFALMRHPLARWLVGGRFMRAFYAVMKAVVFCWLLLLLPLPTLLPGLWADWSPLLQGIAFVLVWLVVALCVARGIPVVMEFLADETARAPAATGER